MKNNYKKYIKIFFAILFCLFFVVFFADKTFALEIEYPTIQAPGGSVSLNQTTKLPDFVKYLFYAGMALGFFGAFISIIVAGVMYILSPVNVQLRANAKDRLSGAVSGIIILTLSYLILTTINPQFVKLNSQDLSPVSGDNTVKKMPGIYFFNKTDCSEKPSQIQTSSTTDLGNLKNKINSVGIVKDQSFGVAYVAVLYDVIGNRGKCQYLNPNQECQQVSPFAASASVYQYDFSPNGDGVYIFRKSFFNPKGGFIFISNSKIKKLYQASLDDLKFEDPSCKNKDNPDNCCVPEKERDCIKYDKNGLCDKDGLSCPSLGGENISSIGINGNYFVLLTYAGPGESCSSAKSTACQGFPTPDDINKIGPSVIKWEKIRNNAGIVPNCITIIPVKNK